MVRCESGLEQFRTHRGRDLIELHDARNGFCDNGKSFQFTATNSAGSATSAAATLTVNPAPVPPTITSEPQSQTVTAGQTATFMVAATGTAPLTYQWSKTQNGTTAAINGATSSTYTTPTTTTADSGSTFTVTVTNGSGSATSNPPAKLTVNAATTAPTITTQPINQTVTAGQTATFTAAASGNPTPTVQWQVSTNGGGTFTNVSGATSTTYSFTTTAAQNGNQFRAVFTNSAGSATSNAATLTVNPANQPTVTLSAVPDPVTLGSSTTLTWTSTNATSCTASGSWSGTKATSGSEVQTPTAAGPVDYVLMCTGPGGNFTASTGFTVTYPVPNVTGISPSSAAAGSASFPLTVNGTKFFPASVVDWNGAGLATTYVSSTQLTASVPAAQIAVPGTFAVAVLNPTTPAPGGGSSNAVNFTVNPSTPPKLISAGPPAMLPREGGGTMTIVGTGMNVGDTLTFYLGSTVAGTNTISSIATNAQGQQTTSIQFVFDTPRYNPGPIGVTDTNAVGTSNQLFFDFLGFQDMLAASSSQYYFLDQGTGILRIYDASLDSVTTFTVGQLSTGIAADSSNGAVMAVTNRSIGVFCSSNNGTVFKGCNAASDANQDLIMAVTAMQGSGCFTAEIAGALSCFPDIALNSAVTTIPVSSTPTTSAPMDVAMGMVNNQLTAAVLNVGDGNVAWTEVPAMPAMQAVALPGFTRVPSPTTTANISLHDWKLKMFANGSAAVLSRFDRSVWFVDLTTGNVRGPFVVPSDPFNIIVDDAGNRLIVALADPTGASGGTKLVPVDFTTGFVGANGVPNQLLQSSPAVLAIGARMSLDGTHIVSCMRNTCEFDPTN